MKTYLIFAFLFISLHTNAFNFDSQMPGKPSQTFLSPTHRISIITKEGYRLNGLLMTSNDSQLIIFPGKHKEWKVNKKYMIVYYPYYKIETVRLFNVRSKSNRLFHKSRRNLVHINGCKNHFLIFRQSLGM